MKIVEILVYVCSIVIFAIYIHFEKLKCYREGFSDGVKEYSDMVEGVLQRVNQWNKEAEEAGMCLAAYIESIKPINWAESEEDEDGEI